MPWKLREKDASRDFEMFKALIKAQLINPPKLMWGSGSTFLEISLDGAWSQSSIERLYAFCKEHGYEATLATRTFNEAPRFVISFCAQTDGGIK